MAFTRRRSCSTPGRQSESVHWPGEAGGAIAAPADNIVLYWGLPTTGALIKYTKGNSIFHGGPMQAVP